MKSDGNTETQNPQRGRTIGEVYEQGLRAFRHKKFDDAISLCRQILGVAPDSTRAFNLLAESLKHSGGIKDEIKALKSAIESGGGESELYEKLGELQRVAGDFAGAISSLERAAAANPDRHVSRLRLAIAYYENSDLAAAEKEFRRVLEMAPRLAPAHFFLGNIYRNQKNPRGALDSYSTAIELDANHMPACLNLAQVLYNGQGSEDRTGDLNRAAELVLRTIRARAGGFINHLIAGKILIELERYEEAIEILEAAEKFKTKHSDYYVALSLAYGKLNKFDKAQDASRRLLREFPVGSRLCANPEAHVLVLETLRDDLFLKLRYGSAAYGNKNAIGSLPPDRVSLHHAYIHGITQQKLEEFKEKYDVIYNNAANAETNIQHDYSSSINNIINKLNIPTFNTPDRIDLTTRANNYERLAEIDHFIFPKTVAVFPETDNVAEILAQVEADFTFPILVRVAGGHRATNLEKVDDVNALRDLLIRFTSKPCYVIQYHESRHHTGLFLRYRGIFVGGEFYPSRMNLSNSWLVAASSSRKKEKNPIEGNSELQNEEMRWLADPAETIGQANMAALFAADDIIKLDFCGFDFGIAEDGRVIVFEANACMNALSIRKHIANYPYLEKPAGDIKSALETLLIDRAHGRA